MENNVKAFLLFVLFFKKNSICLHVSSGSSFLSMYSIYKERNDHKVLIVC